jgi:hypothetical protein
VNPAGDLISFDLARRLQTAGLLWRPVWGDYFHIPDRHLDDRVFMLADLSVEVTTLADGIGAITFNGAVEWSLDYILTQDVVWVPTETQLRSSLGTHLIGLSVDGDMLVCEIALPDGEPERHRGASASEAYGRALLSLLAADANR